MYYIDDTTSYRREVKAHCDSCTWTSDDFLAEGLATEHANATSHRVVVHETRQTTFNAGKNRRSRARRQRDPDRRT